jgi:predicted acetyltransferase
MEIRNIRRKELNRFREIITQAFVLAPHQVEHYLGDDLDLSVTRAVFRDGQMKSALQLLPGKVWFNQKAIPMGRIAWVATPPEERRRGYVHHLMEHCIEEMRQRQFPISILFPFSFEYYRKFGYEHA